MDFPFFPMTEKVKWVLGSVRLDVLCTPPFVLHGEMVLVSVQLSYVCSNSQKQRAFSLVFSLKKKKKKTKSWHFWNEH